jgi:DNA polymerase V
VFALVDVNNFYASCEMLFDVSLRGKPLVVLSNNDGCVIARSAEAKALGIKMAEPWHHARERHPQLIHRSSNYELYADMSARVMRVLVNAVPNVEVYSIDESFLDMTGIANRLVVASALRMQIRQWIGLPVCVGIGSTKTRAKLANHVAKKQAEHEGIFDLESLTSAACSALLSEIDVGSIWGVGRRLKARLAVLGINTARDLRDADSEWIRAHSSVVLQRTVSELRGQSCLALEPLTPPRKQIVVSRSFGTEVENYRELREAVVTHVSRAAEKLRHEGLVARHINIFLHTNKFRGDRAQYSNELTVKLHTATDDTLELTNAADRALQRIYRDGFKYQKVGVLLSELMPACEQQSGLFVDKGQAERRAQLNRTLDRINHKYGRDVMRLAASGTERVWSMRRSTLSPRYTTRWEDVPIAHAR